MTNNTTTTTTTTVINSLLAALFTYLTGKAVDSGNYNYNIETYLAIADASEELTHEPQNPAVVAAYSALIREVIAQFRFLVSQGFRLLPWLEQGQPYHTSAEMRADVTERRRLFFFVGGDIPQNHPLAQKTGIIVRGYELTANDAFRAVHDVFGHAITGANFSARGEFNATHTHAAMFSEQALPALLAETIYQNAWVNCGKHLRRADGKTLPKKGDADYVPPAERPYAPQKAINITPELVALWRQAYDTDSE